MLPVVFGIGILIAMIAASKARAATGPGATAAAAAPAGTAGAVQRIVDSGDPKKIVAAIAVAQQAGETQLAADLTKAARNVAVTTTKVYPSPWANVPAAGWTRFVLGMRGSSPKTITPGYSLGLFGFGMRRLVDLGLAHDAHQGEHNGKKVWLAEWAPAWSPGPDKFLGDADGQYRTFIKSNQQYAARIQKEIPEAIGATLEGRAVTMSGLLAVAHRAGWDGMRKFLADPKVRAEHKQSTDIFNKSNGAF